MNDTTDFRFRRETKAKSATSYGNAALSSSYPAGVAALRYNQ